MVRFAALVASETSWCRCWTSRGTTFLGTLDYYNSKPPLQMWLVALSFKAFEPGLVSLRLPSIVAAWRTVALLMWWAGRVFGRATWRKASWRGTPTGCST